jgi:hypothetical protein
MVATVTEDDHSIASFSSRGRPSSSRGCGQRFQRRQGSCWSVWQPRAFADDPETPSRPAHSTYQAVLLPLDLPGAGSQVRDALLLEIQIIQGRLDAAIPNLWSTSRSAVQAALLNGHWGQFLYLPTAVFGPCFWSCALRSLRKNISKLEAKNLMIYPSKAARLLGPSAALIVKLAAAQAAFTTLEHDGIVFPAPAALGLLHCTW